MTKSAADGSSSRGFVVSLCTDRRFIRSHLTCALRFRFTKRLCHYPIVCTLHIENQLQVIGQLNSSGMGSLESTIPHLHTVH